MARRNKSDRTTGAHPLRLHKATGQGYVLIDGRRYYQGKYDRPATRERADRFVAEYRATGRVPTAVGPITVTEIVAAFFKYAEVYYRHPDGRPTSELSNYKQPLRDIVALYGRTPAMDFGPMSLKAVRQAMVERDLSRGVVNQHVNRLKRMFRWATENEMVPASVYHGLQSVRSLRKGRSEARETSKVKPVPVEHIDAVIPVVSAPVAAMIRLQLYTAMRPGEVVQMRAGDVDSTGDVWTYVPSSHKTAHLGHDRTIHLGPLAQGVLRGFLDRPAGSYLFSPREAESARNARRRLKRRSPMTPSQAKRRRKSDPERTAGDCYDVRSYRRAIARACRKGAIPTWSPHRLRHNAATSLRHEFGIEAARVILGHRSSVVTEVYAEVDRKKAREIMRSVG